MKIIVDGPSSIRVGGKFPFLVLSSIESKISEAVINDEISHGDFMIITNEEAKRSDSEKINLIEGGKNIGIDKVVKRCEFINSNYFIINI